MTGTNDLLPFATGTGANVDTQADWATNTNRLLGFVAGTASSAQFNKAVRQAAFAASMIGQFTADNSGENTVDDGNVATFLSNFEFALNAQIGTYITNNSGSLSALSTPNDFLNAGTMAGSANAIAATCTPTCAAPPHTGAILIGRIGTTNTSTSVTLKADSAAAITVKLADGSTAPGVGALQSGHLVMLSFNGTNWLALFDFTIGAIIGAGASTPYLPLAGGTTTGLVNLSGGFTSAYRSLSANTTLTTADLGSFIELTGTSGFTTTLPSASSQPGSFTCWNASTVTQTLGGSGSTFPGPKGSGAGTLSVPSGAAVRVNSDGTSWVVTGYVDLTSYATSGVAVGVQLFTSSGTYTPTAGTTKFKVEVVGAGGSGGGETTVNTAGSAPSGGGGAGGYSSKLFTYSGGTGSVTIGSGGASVATGTSGNAGGASSFAYSGTTLTANGGGGGSSNLTYATGGVGGTASGGDINIPGNPGIGGSQSGFPGQSGNGGSAHLGGAGIGGYWGGAANVQSPTAGVMGSGGGGGNGPQSSGAGGNGFVLITEFK